MTCAVARATFRLLDPVGGWDAAASRHVSETGDGLTLTVDRPRLSAVDAQELARCLLIGAAALIDETQAAFDVASDRWDQLVRVRSITARAGQPPFQQMQRELLNDLGARITRLRAYEKHVADLPKEDRMEDLSRQLTKAIAGWASEIVRLRRFI